MALTQRPVNDKTLIDPMKEVSWRSHLACFAYGGRDECTSCLSSLSHRAREEGLEQADVDLILTARCGN
jgi:hypothetical protein